MFFTSCEGTCALTVEHLKEIKASLPGDVRSRASFVLVSLDPVRDTPAALAMFRSANRLSPERWLLLRGSPAATADLAGYLPVRRRCCMGRSADRVEPRWVSRPSAVLSFRGRSLDCFRRRYPPERFPPSFPTADFLLRCDGNPAIVLAATVWTFVRAKVNVLALALPARKGDDGLARFFVQAIRGNIHVQALFSERLPQIKPSLTDALR